MAPARKNGHAAARFTSARDLDEQEFDPINYVVPGYIAEGLTLLAGKPKLGKSWLCLDIALAVASGGMCLGNVACEQGDVLYLALEDNLRRLQSRLHKLWATRTWPATARSRPNLFFATEWRRAGDGGVEDIREWIEDHPEARLVIVDVLAMFKATARSQTQTLYEADYGALKGLQSLAMETGVAIVVVHHTRKSAAESGPLREGLAAPWACRVRPIRPLFSTTTRTGRPCTAEARDIPEIETAVLFDRVTCRWSALGKVAEVRRTDERAAILSNLIDATEPTSPLRADDRLRDAPKQCRPALVQDGKSRRKC